MQGEIVGTPRRWVSPDTGCTWGFPGGSWVFCPAVVFPLEAGCSPRSAWDARMKERLFLEVAGSVTSLYVALAKIRHLSLLGGM